MIANSIFSRYLKTLKNLIKFVNKFLKTTVVIMDDIVFILKK